MGFSLENKTHTGSKSDFVGTLRQRAENREYFGTASFKIPITWAGLCDRISSGERISFSELQSFSLLMYNRSMQICLERGYVSNIIFFLELSLTCHKEILRTFYFAT